jgi:hypothetical protein
MRRGGIVDLEAIRGRLEASRSGPWARHGADVRDGEGDLVFTGRDGDAELRRQADRDAEFVAHAREDVAALLDALERARPPGERAAGDGGGESTLPPPHTEDRDEAEADTPGGSAKRRHWSADH